jgi:predicted nucleotidyltransferase component of viral defense system
MTKRPLTNVAASVRDRLLKRSRQTGEDFQFLLQRYAAERLLYRLGQSAHRARYVLKGAMLFALWGGLVYRPTRDLDFTGYGKTDANDVIATFKEVCAVAVADDGIVFDPATVTAAPIRDETEYRGLRVTLQAKLGVARIDMQIDIGFANAIEPGANDVQYPTLLDAPAPNIRAYPHEAVVAEKLHTLVVLGERNSRIKDLYDLYTLATQFPFEGTKLTRAISATFDRRKTKIDSALPVGLAPRFFAGDARAAQWRAYLDRNELPGAPRDLAQAGERIQAFLGPVWSSLIASEKFAGSWRPGGPWEAKL